MFHYSLYVTSSLLGFLLLYKSGLAFTKSMNLLIDDMSCNILKVTRCYGSFNNLINDIFISFNCSFIYRSALHCNCSLIDQNH